MSADPMHYILPLAQQPPTADGLYWLLLGSRVLHILGAIILLGGLIFVRHVVKPTVTAGMPDAFFDARRASWAKWIGISTALLLLSGALNYGYVIAGLERMAKPYHMLAGIKILLSLALFLLAALLAGKTALAQRLREKFYVWLTVAVLLGIAIVIIGAALRTFPRTPKAANVEASLVAPANPLGIQS
jgi:hypothetical protein